MFEDECQRASLRRRGVIARGVAKRCLVAFLAFAMAFSTTPAQLWAEGAEGITDAVAQATTPGEDAALAGGTAEQSGAEVSDSGSAPAASAATTEAATGDEGSATGESPATSERSSTASAGQAGSAAAAAVQTENPTETGDVVKKQIEVSFSIIGTDADGKAQTWVAPTQLKLDEGATAADAFIKLQQKRLQGGLRSEHGIRFLPRKHHIPERWPHACLRSDDLCLLAAVRRRRVFLGWREQRQAHPGAED